MALIEEAGGDKSRALEDFRGVRSRLGGRQVTLSYAVDAGIKRLSGGR